MVYELERRFTKFVEMTLSKSHYYAVQGHSMSPISVPIESYEFLLVVNSLPPILHRFQVIAYGQIFASERGVSHFDALARGDHRK